MSVNALACVPTTRPGPEREASPWVVPLGTPAHDYSARESLNPEPQLLWKTDAGRASRGSPAIGDEVVVVSTVDRMLVVVERQTGEVLWRRRLASSMTGGPLIDQDRVYVATELAEGRVYSLRLRDGRAMWSQRLRDVSAPVLLMGDLVVAANDRGVVVGYDAERGSMRWRRQLGGGGAIRAAPAAFQGAVLVAVEDSLFALDRTDGTTRTAVRLPGRGAVIAAPAVHGGALYLGTTSGRVLKLSLPDLSLVWEVSANAPIAGSVAVVRDTVFALTRAGTLWLIPVEDGAAARQVAVGGAAVAGPTPLASGGGVLVGTVSGEILLVNPATGLPMWHTRVDGPIEQPPLVRDRTLVVVSGRGDLLAYR